MSRSPIRWVPALGVLVGMLACVLACGGSKPAEAPSAPSAMQSPPATSSATPTAAAPSSAATASESAPPAPTASAPAPLATVLTNDASTVQKLFDSTSQAAAATLKDKDAAGRDPLAPGLKDVARKAAPGMVADGPLATGNLKEKQNQQTDVTLVPGKCYAVVGY